MLRRFLTTAILLVSVAAPPSFAAAQPGPEPLTVFAAASLKNVFDEAAAAFAKQSGRKVRTSYAGSMTLARQIEQGAPADVFCAADQETMDYAATRKLIREASRRSVLANSLVVIAHRSAAFDTLPLTVAGLDRALGERRLSMGDPVSVPAGRYARAALERLKLWTALQGRLAFSENVRAAMLYVSRDEAALGVVYATDAAAEPLVKIVARFPPDSHPPIIYPCAGVAGRDAAGADSFLAFLKSQAARRIFEKAGFLFAP